MKPVGAFVVLPLALPFLRLPLSIGQCPAPLAAHLSAAEAAFLSTKDRLNPLAMPPATKVHTIPPSDVWQIPERALAP